MSSNSSAKPKSKSRKIVDIAHPEDAEPDIGSKPMIIGHSTSAKDTTLKTESDTSIDVTDAPEDPKPVERKPKKKIKPLSEEEKSEANGAAHDEGNDSDSADSGDEQPTSADAETDKSASPQELVSSEAASKQEEAKNVDNDSSEDSEEEAELEPGALELERAEKLRSMVESKKYRVSIKESSDMSLGKLVGIVVGVLLAGAVALFLLIDSGIIESDVELPFSVFGEQVTLIEPVIAPAPAAAQEGPAEEPQAEEEFTQTTEQDESPEDFEVASLFPAEWGELSEITSEAGFYAFDEQPNLAVKIHEDPTSIVVDVSFQVQSSCIYNGVEWSPFVSEFQPEECPDGTRDEGAATVSFFEYGAEGAYAYVEVVVIGDRAFELREVADSTTDFEEVDSTTTIKDGVVDRIKQSLPLRTGELLATNNQ